MLGWVRYLLNKKHTGSTHLGKYHFILYLSTTWKMLQLKFIPTRNLTKLLVPHKS